MGERLAASNPTPNPSPFTERGTQDLLRADYGRVRPCRYSSNYFCCFLYLRFLRHLYSRSPAHIERIRREFRVGNLYINRPITGALVDRQPFGGFKLSGIGTKAGGSDYLREFLLTRTITENTMRRGFAPETDVELQSAGGTC